MWAALSFERQKLRQNIDSGLMCFGRFWLSLPGGRNEVNGPPCGRQLMVILATTGIVVRTWALPRILTYSEAWDVLEARQALIRMMR